MNDVLTQATQKVHEYTNSRGWKYSMNDDEFQIGFNISNQLKECRIHIYTIPFGNGIFSLHTITTCPLVVSQERQRAIIELITRINYNRIDGYFNFRSPKSDSECGRIEYISWLYCNNTIPSLNDVGYFVDIPLQMMMTYGDALYNVAMRNSVPVEEIQRVEG